MTGSSQHAPQEMEAQLADLQAQIAQLQNLIHAQQNALNALPAGPAPAAPAVAAPAPHIKPDRPPPFTGKKSESLEAWIFQMQQFCEVAPVPAGE